MIKFNSVDPFPLLPADSYTYQDAQAHAREVDEWLGLDTASIEAKISERFRNAPGLQDQQLWLDLPVQTLQTPYVEIREMLGRFDKAKKLTVVDLGCAYGRIALVIAKHFPLWSFIGYEFVRERVEAAQKLISSGDQGRIEIVEADLNVSGFALAPADIYFIYDYGSRYAIQKTLLQLQLVAKKRAIVVVGRGRASRDAIEGKHPWLSQVIAPMHLAHYSVYRSGEGV